MSIHHKLSRSFHRSARFWALLLVVSLATAALLAFLGASRTSAQVLEVVYFMDCAAPTDVSHTILVPGGVPRMHTAGYFTPVAGDEFAVFRPVGGTCATTADSLCTAAMVYQGPTVNDAVSVVGDSAATFGIIDGMLAGEEMCWHVWDASEGKEYTATVVYSTFFPNYSGLFVPGGISGLETLTPTALKLTSFQAASQSAWVARSALLAGSALLIGAAIFFFRRRQSA